MGANKERAFRALVLVVACAITTLTGCASMQQRVSQAGDVIRTHGGTMLGAAAGAAAGALLCDDDNRVKCAVAGGVVGASLGYLWDKRRARLHEIAKQKHISIKTASVQTFNSKKQNGLAMAVDDGNMFPSGSGQLTSDAAAKLRALAAAYRDKPQHLLIIGHTDSTGDDAFNLNLSEKRARTVAKLFASQGIDRSRLFFQGVGESQPIASNDTAAGRAVNRRVDVVETNNARDLAAYSLERESDVRYLAHSNKTREEKGTAAAAKARQTASPESPRHPSAQVAKRASSPAARAPSKTPNARDAGNDDVVASSTAVPETSPVSAGRAGPASKEGSPEVDFGGEPARSDISRLAAAAGPMESSGGSVLGLIGSAHAADDDAISPCYMNSPRRVAAIRNLASGQILDTSNIDEADYWPGLNGNIWLATVNGNLVALKNLRVMAGSATVVGQPQMLVYRNYHPGQQTPDFRNIAHVKSYRGRDGLILRTYFDGDAPMKCMDVVMANRSERSAKAGMLYYDGARTLYQNSIRLHRLGAGS